METYKIEPEKKISLQIKEGFFSSQAMVSIKALGVNTDSRTSLHFTVTFLDANGNTAGFPIILESPYYFDAGRSFSGDDLINKASTGPFYVVEITSEKPNPPLVIQVGFTNRLA